MLDIEPDTFYGCSNLVSISLPDGIRSIGDYAFRWCAKLSSINLPDEVRSIGESAFHGCVALESFTLPRELRSLENNAFYKCEGMEAIYNESLFMKITNINVGDENDERIVPVTYNSVFDEIVGDFVVNYNLDIKEYTIQRYIGTSTEVTVGPMEIWHSKFQGGLTS